MVEKWEQEAVEAMEKRFEDISAMDIYDVQKIKREFPSLPSHFGHSLFGRERLCSANPEGERAVFDPKGNPAGGRRSHGL